MNLWNKVLLSLELPYSIVNPYWNKTKGEMADECLNKDILLEIIRNLHRVLHHKKLDGLGCHPSIVDIAYLVLFVVQLCIKRINSKMTQQFTP